MKSKLSISGMLTVHLNHPSKLGIPKQPVEQYVDFETTGRIYYKDSPNEGACLQQTGSLGKVALIPRFEKLSLNPRDPASRIKPSSMFIGRML